MPTCCIPAGPGARWKFPTLCGAGVCYPRDGRGSAEGGRRPSSGWDPHPRVFLCARTTWPEHAGCTDCRSNNGWVFSEYFPNTPPVFILFRFTDHQSASCQALNRGKGLLPEPTAMQILTGLNNPAALKMLLAPLTQGRNCSEICKQVSSWNDRCLKLLCVARAVTSCVKESDMFCLPEPQAQCLRWHSKHFHIEVPEPGPSLQMPGLSCPGTSVVPGQFHVSLSHPTRGTGTFYAK